MKTLALYIFIFTGWNVISQNSGYTFCGWEDITVKESYLPGANDTPIVFVSCRNYFPGKEKFLDYDFDSTNTLHYFNIYFNHNKWICVHKTDLTEAVSDTKAGKDMVIYAEGLGKTFCNNVDRATRLARTYNVVPVMFDWPTARPFMKDGKNMKKTIAVSEAVAKPFSDFVKEFGKLKKEGKIPARQTTLFLHSMGNLLLMHAVKKNYLDSVIVFDNVVLNAACVPQKNHKEWVEKIKIQKKIFITKNNHDRSLNGAKILTFQKQLGERPKRPFADNALYISFNKVLHLEHNYFLYADVLLRHPEIKEIYSSIFHGEPLLPDDIKKFKRHSEKNVVDLVKPYLPQKGEAGLIIGL